MIIKTPKDGDYRYKTEFALLPKRFNGVIAWLETVTIRQVYLSEGILFNPGWVDVCLSNPLTGNPADFEVTKDTPLLKIPMDKVGIYPNTTKDSYIKKLK